MEFEVAISFFIGGKNMRHIGEKIILVLCIAVFGIAAMNLVEIGKEYYDGQKEYEELKEYTEEEPNGQQDDPAESKAEEKTYVNEKEKLVFLRRIKQVVMIILVIQILLYVTNLESYQTTITYSLGIIIFSMFLGRIKNRIDKV